MSRWFRHYAGMMRDDKLVSVALRSKQSVERVLWVWGAILESAAEIDDAGRFELDGAEVAYFLRADEADIGRVLAALEATGRIFGGRVVNWGSRQFQSDRSADRQKRHRERRKAESDDLSIESDAGVTAASRHGDGGVTSPSRHGDAPETETETETEKIDAIASCAVGKPTRTERSSDFEEFWKAYPRRDGANPKAPAERQFRAAVKAGADPAAIIAGARRCSERDRDRVGTPFIPQAVKWLRDKRWQDYADAPAQPTTELIHVMQDSPEWPSWAALWRQQRGRDPPIDKLGGWHFPVAWSEQRQAAE